MHFLDGLVGEDLALDTTKSYLRQAVYIGRTVTKDLNKSASIGSFQERNEIYVPSGWKHYARDKKI